MISNFMVLVIREMEGNVNMIKADVTMIVTATGYNRYFVLLWRWVLVVTFVETDDENFLR